MMESTFSVASKMLLLYIEEGVGGRSVGVTACRTQGRAGGSVDSYKAATNQRIIAIGIELSPQRTSAPRREASNPHRFRH